MRQQTARVLRGMGQAAHPFPTLGHGAGRGCRGRIRRRRRQSYHCRSRRRQRSGHPGLCLVRRGRSRAACARRGTARLADLRAVAAGRVYCIPDEFLNTPRPHPLARTGLACLAAAIHPNSFPLHPRSDFTCRFGRSSHKITILKKRWNPSKLRTTARAGKTSHARRGRGVDSARKRSLHLSAQSRHRHGIAMGVSRRKN